MVLSFQTANLCGTTTVKNTRPSFWGVGHPQNKNILPGITTSFYKFYLPINEGQKAFMPRTDSQRSPRYFDPPHPPSVTQISVELCAYTRGTEWSECYCANSAPSGRPSVPRSVEIIRIGENAQRFTGIRSGLPVVDFGIYLHNHEIKTAWCT